MRDGRKWKRIPIIILSDASLVSSKSDATVLWPMDAERALDAVQRVFGGRQPFARQTGVEELCVRRSELAFGGKPNLFFRQKRVGA